MIRIQCIKIIKLMMMLFKIARQKSPGMKTSRNIPVTSENGMEISTLVVTINEDTDSIHSGIAITEKTQKIIIAK